MAESLKSLIDQRNKAVHDAREILSRAESEGRELLAEEQGKADELLDAAGELDKKIEAHNKANDRKVKLSALESRQQEAVPRQIEPSRPGSNPAPRPDSQALTISFRGKDMVLSPGTPLHQRATQAYREGFLSYMVGGGSGERLGLVTSKDSKGGYLAPMTMVQGLIKFLDNTVVMRQICNVLPPMADVVNLGVLSWDADPGDADWTAEVPASDITEDDSATLGRREMMPQLLTKLVKMSKKLLRVAGFDIEGFLVQRLGYKFGITEEKAFLTGTGVGQPLGVFTASNDGLPTSRDVVCASATALAADDLINALYSLKEAYQRNATWLVGREFIKRVRKLKDSQNQYLWASGIAGGAPGTILDRPYTMSEYVPATYTASQYVGAVGDFRAGYTIVDGLNLEVQRLAELFALKNQVGLLAAKETDGAPVLAEAISRIQMAAS